MTKIDMEKALEKLIKIADALDKDKSELAPEMAEIITVITKAHKDEPDQNSYTNIWDMLHDIRAHADANGHAIVQNDNPFRLCLGYRCTNTNKTWSIRISDLKKSQGSPPVSQTSDIAEPVPSGLEMSDAERKAEILQRCFQTQDGKLNLLDVINKK